MTRTEIYMVTVTEELNGTCLVRREVEADHILRYDEGTPIGGSGDQTGSLSIAHLTREVASMIARDFDTRH